MIKDNFSARADMYAKYRPNYPQELIDEILLHCANKDLAWDCATGNGQIASALSPFFYNIFASDISQSQLDNAIQKPNIAYKLEHAENSTLRDKSVDLIVVAQAIHWFNFDAFYNETKRVLKPDGIIAVLGYGLFQSIPQIDNELQKFYVDILGKYWDDERKYLDEKYNTIPFPFNEIKTAKHFIKLTWTYENIIGYLNTWSAVQHYIKQHNSNPVLLITDGLKNAFGDKKSVEINIEIFAKVGKL